MNDSESIIAEIGKEFVARLRAGKMPSISEYSGRYPEHAVELRELLGTIELLEFFGCCERICVCKLMPISNHRKSTHWVSLTLFESLDVVEWESSMKRSTGHCSGASH